MRLKKSLAHAHIESPRTAQGKSIYEFDNYRAYLKNTYLNLKSQNKSFSFRFFARVAGFNSPSFLKLVMDGKSNLSELSIEKFSKALKHTKSESQFFKHLVLLNQAKTTEEKKLHAEEIFRLQNYRKIHPFSESLYRYLSRWYFVVIKEMVDLPDFKEDPVIISKKLKSQVSPAEVRRALEEMLEIGILSRDQAGRLYQSKTYVMTNDEVASCSAADYHRGMMQKASECIDGVPRNRRELSALTVGVSKRTADRLKTMIQQFRKDIMELCMQDMEPESVYQVNLHLFPLVESESKTEEGEGEP